MFTRICLSYLLSFIILNIAACSTLESPPDTEPDAPNEQPQETPAEPVAPRILSFDLSADDLTVTLVARAEQGSKEITEAIVFWGDGDSDKINSEFETISISHSYADPGIYQVKLELSDGTLMSSDSKTVSARLPEPIGEKVRVTFERIQVGKLLDCQLFGVFGDVQLSGVISLNGNEVWSITEATTSSSESIELDVVSEVDVFYGEDAFVVIEGELVHASNPLEKIDSWSINLPLNDGLYKSYASDDGSGTRTNYCFAGLYYQIERSGYLY